MTPVRYAWYKVQNALWDYFSENLETYSNGFAGLDIVKGMAGEIFEDENIYICFRGEIADRGNSLVTIQIGVSTHAGTDLERHAMMMGCIDDLIFDGTAMEPHTAFLAGLNALDDTGVRFMNIETDNGLPLEPLIDGMLRQTHRTIEFYVRQT